MKAWAVVRLKFSSSRQLRVVLRAVEPETRSQPTPRSRVQVRGEGETLLITFEASDTVALRAAVNSYLRWISLIHDACSVLESLSREAKTLN